MIIADKEKKYYLKIVSLFVKMKRSHTYPKVMES